MHNHPFMHLFSITHPFEYIFIDIYALDTYPSIYRPLCITYPECCIFIDVYALYAFLSIYRPLCIPACNTLFHYPDYLLIRASLAL